MADSEHETNIEKLPPIITLGLKVIQVIISLIALILSVIGVMSMVNPTGGVVTFLVFAALALFHGLVFLIIACLIQGPGSGIYMMTIDMTTAAMLSAAFYPLSLLSVFEGPTNVAAGVFGFIDMAVLCLVAVGLSSDLAKRLRSSR